MSKRRSILVVISGFSGSGKGTVISKMQEMYPDRYRLSISATTRSPRENEVDRVHYFFVSRERFEEMIRQNLLLEHASYNEKYYGTPAGYVNEQLDAGYDVILEIESNGAFQIRESMPEAVLIFMAPASVAELERRLRGRKSESEEDIRARLAIAAKEALVMDRYDYFVVNDRPEDCARLIHDIIETQKSRTCENMDMITSLREEFAGI